MSRTRLQRSIVLASLSCLLASGSAWPQSGDSTALRAELLQSAQRWSDKGRTDLARQMLAKLLAIDPDSAEGLAFAADLALRDGKPDEASQILKTMQARQPQHPATRELQHVYEVYTQQREKLARMRLMARAGRRSEAAQLARELFPEGTPRYGALGREIAQLTGQSRPVDTQLARAQPKSTPTARNTAKVARTAKVPQLAQALPKAAKTAQPEIPAPPSTQEAASVAPDSPAPVSEAALASARADGLRAQADTELKAERLSPALRLLEEAVQLTPDEPWLRYDLARLYARLQLPTAARSVLDDGLQRQPADTDMRYAHALLLSSLDDDAGALADLQKIPADQRSTGMQALEQRLSRNLVLNQAASASPAQSEAMLQTALAASPQDADLRLALANASQAQGDFAAAHTQAQWLQTHLQATDIYRRLALLRLLQRLGQTQAARAESHDLQQRFPDNVDVLLHAARLERSDGRYSDALALFQQAGQTERAALQPGVAPDGQTLDKIEQDIASIQARRQAWVEVGQLTIEKNSTEGLSSLRGWERPVVAWLPWAYEGRVFAHVDPVHLDAGSYAGGDPFAQPGTEAITRGLPQNADGLNVGVGYQGDDWRWDLGETGVGFAVHNWVGGVRYGSDFDSLAYSLELSRRPLTGTLLSYAGATDPQSGAAWGGVVATGVGGRLAKDIGPYSTSLSASYATLTGLNVEDNTRLQWRLAADRDIYSDKTQLVNVGLALSGLEHDRDLSGFTWGHGGYYSPVHNVSLALPVEWSGRKGAFTWLLKGSVSVSSSTSTATDYYPGNAAMQQASGQAYSASSSTGSGWAASGAAEYQVDRHLAIGGVLAREVSDYYTPLNLTVYARYLFDPVHEPLARKPRPVQPYSQF